MELLSNLLYNNGGAGEFVDSNNNAVTLNAWQFVTMTYTSASKVVSFYVNAVSQGSGTLNADPLTSSQAFTIGNNTATDRAFNGSLDDVRIYNRALSAQEVKRLYNMGR